MSQNDFHSALEIMPFSLGESQQLINLNQIWEKKFGWDTDVLLKNNYKTFIHPEDLKNFESERNKKCLTIFKCRFRCKNNHYLSTKWTINYDASSDKTIGIVEISEDPKEENNTNLLSKTNITENREVFSDTALSMLPYLISYIDADLKYQYMNKTYEKWFHISTDDFIGKKIFDLTGIEIAEMALPYIKDALKGEEQNYELTLPLNTNHNLPQVVKARYMPDRSSDGQIRGIVSVIEDITNLKLSAMNSLEREKKLNALFNNLTQGVLLHAKDGQIIEFNQTTLKILGLSRDQLLGKTSYDPQWKVVSEAHSPIEPADHPAMIALRSGVTVTGRILGVSKPEGEMSWVSVTAVPLFKQNDLIPFQVLVTIEDITKFKNLKEDLKSKIKWKNAILNGFSNAVIATLPNGIITHFNKSAEKLLGYSADEVIGQHTPFLFHDEKEVLERSIALSKELGEKIEPSFRVFQIKALKDGVDINHWTYIKKSGQRILVKLTITSIVDDKKCCIGFIGTAEEL